MVSTLKQHDPARIRIARRIARELRPGTVVNLGVGIPTLIPDYVAPGNKVFLQSENGLLGMGPTPPPEELDMDLINASKHPVTLESGASLFNSADSFAMIRGGHIDLAVLGALQVSETGEIANWAVPGQDIVGVGGAMDLVAGAKKIIVAMTHVTKDGQPKLVSSLAYPTSGIRPASMVVTEKAVFEFEDGRMILREMAEDTSLDDIRRTTEASFEVSEDWTYMPC